MRQLMAQQFLAFDAVGLVLACGEGDVVADREGLGGELLGLAQRRGAAVNPDLRQVGAQRLLEEAARGQVQRLAAAQPGDDVLVDRTGCGIAGGLVVALGVDLGWVAAGGLTALVDGLGLLRRRCAGQDAQEIVGLEFGGLDLDRTGRVDAELVGLGVVTQFAVGGDANRQLVVGLRQGPVLVPDRDRVDVQVQLGREAALELEG